MRHEQITSPLNYTVLLAGKLVSEYTRRRKKNNPKSVHLVGTDRPEATMIYAGFYHEILASNPLHPIKLTLVHASYIQLTKRSSLT